MHTFERKKKNTYNQEETTKHRSEEDPGHVCGSHVPGVARRTAAGATTPYRGVVDRSPITTVLLTRPFKDELLFSTGAT